MFLNKMLFLIPDCQKCSLKLPIVFNVYYQRETKKDSNQCDILLGDTQTEFIMLHVLLFSFNHSFIIKQLYCITNFTVVPDVMEEAERHVCVLFV